MVKKYLFLFLFFFIWNAIFSQQYLYYKHKIVNKPIIRYSLELFLSKYDSTPDSNIFFDLVNEQSISSDTVNLHITYLSIYDLFKRTWGQPFGYEIFYNKDYEDVSDYSIIYDSLTIVNNPELLFSIKKGKIIIGFKNVKELDGPIYTDFFTKDEELYILDRNLYIKLFDKIKMPDNLDLNSFLLTYIKSYERIHFFGKPYYNIREYYYQNISDNNLNLFLIWLNDNFEIVRFENERIGYLKIKD